MATLPTRSFNTIVTNAVSGIQGRAAKFIDFSEGSSLRAIVEGFAGLFLWFQAMVLQVLRATRLSTSTGIDVDTFTADFMPAVPGTTSPRLGAQAASGNVTFARFTAAPSTCFIPAATVVAADGTITNAGPTSAATVTTNDGSNTRFVVMANTGFATYSPTLGGYTLASSVASILVPVQAIVAGAAGNVAAGAISSITSPLQGIDTVTNVAAFSNGADQEGDDALKKRFSDYILGLSRGDVFGLTAAIEGVAVNVEFALTEDYNYDGSYHPGYFFVVADDGTGTPSPAFLNLVNQAAQSVRPLSIQCAVFPPVMLVANLSMQITVAAGYDRNTVIAQVAALLAFNVNSLGLAHPLPWSILSSWAYSVPGVTTVANVLINGAGGDAASISATKLSQDGTYVIGYATIKAGSVSVS